MQLFEYILVKIIYTILRHIPFRFGHVLVMILRIFAQYIFKYRKKVILKNLKSSFPELGEERIRTMISDVYKNFLQLWIEIMQTWRLNNEFLSENFKIFNWEIVEQAIEEKRGLVLVTGHLGNYEWAVHYCMMHLKNVHAIMKRLKNTKINDFMVSIRELTGGKVIYKKNALRKGLKVLKEGKSVAIVSDQHAGSQGIRVFFFGRPASTATGTAIFHLKSGAPIVFVTGIRRDLGKIDIHFERIPVSKNRTLNDKSILALTQLHTSILEKWIREYPTQYFWTHRRWKT
jgi:KDO2-lipid IV(A) lauroyltransferase